MSNYLLLRRIMLKPHHVPTGKTRHLSGNDELPPPHELRIAQILPDEGYYLLYFDGAGNELTDTYHGSLEESLAQAKWEFSVEPDEWENVR